MLGRLDFSKHYDMFGTIDKEYKFTCDLILFLPYTGERV